MLPASAPIRPEGVPGKVTLRQETLLKILFFYPGHGGVTPYIYRRAFRESDEILPLFKFTAQTENERGQSGILLRSLTTKLFLIWAGLTAKSAIFFTSTYVMGP